MKIKYENTMDINNKAIERKREEKLGVPLLSNSATNDAKAKAIRKTACLHMEKILSYT